LIQRSSGLKREGGEFPLLSGERERGEISSPLGERVGVRGKAK